jgi:hypothetical protein
MGLTNIKYDIIIVGTSPISILKYLKEKEKTNSILIIEKEKSIGGLWKSISTEKLEKIEIACHLIEYYHGVYETLEKVFNISFKQKIEPIRISNSGEIEKYHTKKNILISFIKKSILVILMFFVKPINVIFNAKLNFFNINNRSIFDEIVELKIVLFYRIFQLHKPQFIRHPEGGYENFANKISEIVKRKKINLLKDEIIEIDVKNEIKVKTKYNKVIECKRLIVTESFSLLHQNYIIYLHQIFEIKIDSIFENTPQYIHFHDDLNIHRMTKLSKRNGAFFMIQLRKELNENLLLELIVSKFNQLGFNIKVENIELYDLIRSKGYETNDIKAIHNIDVLYSIGDLSKNILKNKLNL